MNNQDRIELARVILDQMIERYMQNDDLQQSMTLQFLLEDDIALQKCDKTVVGKIINTYGPLVYAEEHSKLTTPLIDSSMADKCLKCQGCKRFDVELKR